MLTFHQGTLSHLHATSHDDEDADQEPDVDQLISLSVRKGWEHFATSKFIEDRCQPSSYKLMRVMARY